MKYTTPPPRVDVLTVLPELAERARWTTRLHPRRDQGLPPDANKIGGTILWPNDESWPECESTTVPECYDGEWTIPPDTRIPLVPVLQLHATACPDVAYFPGTDLLQVLWCPIAHSPPIFVAKPYVFWRRASDSANRPTFPPESEFWNKWFLPAECSVNPERVLEFPNGPNLDFDMRRRINEWNPLPAGEVDSGMDLYDAELSTCTGTKIGGHPHWVQEPQVPKCRNGHGMIFLLALTDMEFHAGSICRWCPIEDQELAKDPNRVDEVCCAAFPFFGGGLQNIFVCRQCADWPIASVYQR